MKQMIPLLRSVVLMVLLLCLSACVTSKKYRLAKDDTPPAKHLGYRAVAQPVELQLETVIIFKGPGSWKREARWDEYVVKISNNGDQPLSLDSAQLIDVLGVPQVPGEDPWKLEKLSYTNWDKYGKTGVKVLAGAGAVLIYAGAVEGVVIGAGLSGGAAAGGGLVFLGALPIVAVVDITAVAFMNHNNKEKVMAEFERRRLKLPCVIPVGGSVEGSFFFPMTPGPQRLIVQGKHGGESCSLTLDLKPLAGLHLAAPDSK